MHEVHDRLFVGDERDCFHSCIGWAVIHACKNPCHVKAVGYRGSLPKHHPNYLVLEKGDNLYLNIIDPTRPLFMLETFERFFGFAEHHYTEDKRLLIHCNLGESRAPSLALLFMAKKLNVLPDESFVEASREFLKIYPAYTPGSGISQYLTERWRELG